MLDGEDSEARLGASDMRRFIAEMLDCRMRRDYRRFVEYVSPSVVVYCNAWREGIVGPAIWTGADALVDLFRRTDENYFPLQHEILDIIVDGDKAVVRWRGEWRRHANGKIYTLDAAHFLKWEKDRVVEMHEFFDAHCPSTPACVCEVSFDHLLTPVPSGLDREEMADRLRRLAAFAADGPDEALMRAWCSPNVVSDFIGDRARLPYAGRHRGVEAMIGIIRAEIGRASCRERVS
jgi:ketosteroid isomerase-like protein